MESFPLELTSRLACGGKLTLRAVNRRDWADKISVVVVETLGLLIIRRLLGSLGSDGVGEVVGAAGEFGG